jgi:hypothetical protein
MMRTMTEVMMMTMMTTMTEVMMMTMMTTKVDDGQSETTQENNILQSCYT